MIKDLDSLYTPGRRGKSWLKMKRELATLDVVVTAVEYGHGKRIGVLSDYTFAVWDGERLVNIGKAYSGLTDAEIAEMTQWFLAHQTSEQGLRLEVEPKIVLEVAFNNMMRSTRHESGYALRFPRIVRLRPDKLPEDADTIETVRAHLRAATLGMIIKARSKSFTTGSTEEHRERLEVSLVFLCAPCGKDFDRDQSLNTCQLAWSCSE